MELGMIGLRRMGSNMTRRSLDGGHRVVVYNPINEVIEALIAQGATGSASIADLVGRLAPPRAVWLMVSSGEATESTMMRLS